MEQSQAPALTRGLALLRDLAAEGASSLEQISRRCGWPKSSCLRLLAALEAAGCVTREAQSKRYAALVQLQPIAGGTVAIATLLQDLAQATGCTAECWRWRHDRLHLDERRVPEGTEVAVRAKIGFARGLGEAEAVTQIAFAHLVPRRAWPRAIHVASPAGGDVPIRRAELDRLLTGVRDGGVAIDCAPNANGVRRYAQLHPGGEAIIALAQACGPRATEADPALVTALAQRLRPAPSTV